MAQRFTDNLDRGLVAVNTGGSVFLSWRVQADEYHGVTYNGLTFARVFVLLARLSASSSG